MPLWLPLLMPRSDRCVRTAGMTYCGTLGQWHFVLFSDLIVGKITEGSSRTDPRASEMVSPPECRLLPSSANCFPRGSY
jgi:hypothetical protein